MTVPWRPFRLFRRLSHSLVKRLPLRELSDLLRGGTIVETCIGKDPLLRTIIQLDGDVMTFLAPLALPDESTNKKHWEKVEKRLVTIAGQLDSLVRWVTWGIGSLIVLSAVGDTLREYSPNTNEMWDWGVSLAVSALPGLLLGGVGHIPLVRELLGKLFLKIVLWVDRHARNSASKDDLPSISV